MSVSVFLQHFNEVFYVLRVVNHSHEVTLQCFLLVLTIGIASNANTATPKNRGKTDQPANVGSLLGFPEFGIK